MELLGRGGELLRKRRHLVGLALHGGDRAADLLDHPIEAPLEEAELVGLTRRRAHGQVAPLGLAHHAAGVADPRDQRRRNPFERHRHEDEHHRLEPRVPQAAAGFVQQVVEEARAQIGERGCEDQEVADGVSLVERVGQHREEEGGDEAAVPKPDDQDRDQDDIEKRERIHQPPAIPAALVDEAQQLVQKGGPARHQHDGRGAGLDRARNPPDQAEDESDADHQAPHPVAARDGLEVLEPLLEAGGVVLPASHPRGEGRPR